MDDFPAPVGSIVSIELLLGVEPVDPLFIDLRRDSSSLLSLLIEPLSAFGAVWPDSIVPDLLGLRICSLFMSDVVGCPEFAPASVPLLPVLRLLPLAAPDIGEAPEGEGVVPVLLFGPRGLLAVVSRVGLFASGAFCAYADVVNAANINVASAAFRLTK